MARRPPPDPHEQARVQAAEQEASEAQAVAQEKAQAVEGGPVVSLEGSDPEELLEKLTGVELEAAEDADFAEEAAEFGGLEALSKPFLSKTLMLADHDHDEFYDSRDRELLNENLADRVLYSFDIPDNLTGPFRRVALDVMGEDPDTLQHENHSALQREATRTALVDERTDKQSLGDGTFLEAIMEIHVSSEVRREDPELESDSGGGLTSTLNPFN